MPLVAVGGAGGGVVVVVGVVLGRAAPVPAPVPQPLLGRARQDGLGEHRHRAWASGGEVASQLPHLYTLLSTVNSIVSFREQSSNQDVLLPDLFLPQTNLNKVMTSVTHGKKYKRGLPNQLEEAPVDCSLQILLLLLCHY